MGGGARRGQCEFSSEAALEMGCGGVRVGDWSRGWRAGVRPSPRPGQTRTLRFVSNVTEADRILLRWERYEPLEARDLLSFIVYYKES